MEMIPKTELILTLNGFAYPEKVSERIKEIAEIVVPNDTGFYQ